MNRELYVALDEGAVARRCTAAKVEISVIEPLPAGGTRLVCLRRDDAEAMRKKLKRHLISGQVPRRPYRPKLARW
jgi:hypothetical protein